jgi:hypothetical protein
MHWEYTRKEHDAGETLPCTEMPRHCFRPRYVKRRFEPYKNAKNRTRFRQIVCGTLPALACGMASRQAASAPLISEFPREIQFSL